MRSVSIHFIIGPYYCYANINGIEMIKFDIGKRREYDRKCWKYLLITNSNDVSQSCPPRGVRSEFRDTSKTEINAFAY